MKPPIAHSLSPALHRAAYASLGLDWTYDAIEVDVDGLPAFLASLDASGWTTTPTELVLWCEADGQLTRHATGLFLQTESLPPPRK